MNRLRIHLLCRILVSSLLLAAAATQVHALPPQVEADMLMQEIGESTKAGKYQGLLDKFERIEALRVKVPESFHFHWGKAALESGDPKAAMVHLDLYLSKAGSGAKFYDEALAAYRQAREAAELAAFKRNLDAINQRTGIELVLIPAGSFDMGSNNGYADEKPVHRVNVPAFALGKYEVTQGQWKAVMGNNPSKFTSCGDNCPVESVSWNDVQQFIQRLNQQTGLNFRLPTEAEWEYAARAGSSTKYSWGDNIGRNNANCDGCGSRWDDKSTAPVGSFAPNAFGLYDMHGNVREWVQDVSHANYNGAPTDGSAWMSGGDSSRRVLRGGSWLYSPDELRSANRLGDTPDNRKATFGFRIARTVP